MKLEEINRPFLIRCENKDERKSVLKILQRNKVTEFAKPVFSDALIVSVDTNNQYYVTISPCHYATIPASDFIASNPLP